jgi:imidazolonepropionase-like amidohydrolase
MKLIKSKILFDGVDEKENLLIGFEGDEIKYVGNTEPEQDGDGNEIIQEGDDIVVTPAFIDSHSHIGMVRSGERRDYIEQIDYNESVLNVHVAPAGFVFSLMQVFENA